METKKALTLIVLGILMLQSIDIFAQEISHKDRKKISENHIQNLAEGVLVVKLPSYAKKIEAFDNLINSDKVDIRSKDKLQRDRTATIEDRDESNRKIMQSLKQHFSFCPVKFIYDTSAIHIKEQTSMKMLLYWSLILLLYNRYLQQRMFYLTMPLPK